MGTFAASGDELHRAGYGSIWGRLEARIFRGRLDAALIAGADPSSTPALSSRAERLVSAESRAELASSLRQAVNLAASPPRVTSRAPLNRTAIRATRGELLALAGLLEAGAGAPAGAVALVRRLLIDGASPLYGKASTAPLRASIERAARALSGVER
jgi:hypothetical protein